MGSGTVQVIQLDAVVEFARIGCDQQRIHGLVSLKTKDDEVSAGSERAKVLLSAVADRSGSMGTRRKLELVKDAIAFLVRQLQSRDSFGLVQYDDTIQEIIPLSPIRDGRQRIERAVAALTTGGGTNISGGLLQGISQHQPKQPPVSNEAPLTAAQVRAVFLFTDGLATVGVCSTPELVRAMNGALEGVGVANLNVFTFGFGNDHDETMLSELAKSSGGSYYFIESPEKIPAAFADALGGLLSVVSQNIRLVIRPSPGTTIKVRTSYPSAACGDNGGVEINIGDIYSGETRDVVVEAVVPAGEEGVVLWTAEVKYFDIANNQFQQNLCSAPLLMRGLAEEGAALPAPDGAFERVAQHRRRVDAVAAMEEGMRLADLGRIQQASSHLQQTLAAMPMGAVPDPVSATIDRDIREMVNTMSTPEGYRNGGRKKMMHRRMEHARQRAATVDMNCDDEGVAGAVISGNQPPPAIQTSTFISPLLTVASVEKGLARRTFAPPNLEREFATSPMCPSPEMQTAQILESPRHAGIELAARARKSCLHTAKKLAVQRVDSESSWMDGPSPEPACPAQADLTATVLVPPDQMEDVLDEHTLQTRPPVSYRSPYQTKAKADMVSKVTSTQ